MEQIQELINEGFILFTFSGINTYINNRGEEKKKPIGLFTVNNPGDLSMTKKSRISR